MSAIIELKDSSYKTAAKVYNEALPPKGHFKIVADAGCYLAVALRKSAYMEPARLIELLEKESRGILIGPNRSLSRARKALGRIAIAFYHGEEIEKETHAGEVIQTEPSPAELGLATMHPVLKYQKPERKKK